jgi:phosphatidylinositol alpha-1,6-mannosyltransferase
MSKTLVISRVFPPQVGGSGRFLWEVYRRQPAHEYCFAVGEHAGSEAFDRECPFVIERLPLHVGNWGLLPFGFPAYLANYWRLRKFALRERVVAVHAATLFPEGLLGLALSRKLGAPFVCFVHGEETPTAAASRELSWLARRILNGARRIIANSENTRRMILRYWPVDEKNVTVITPGVDVQRFRPAARDAAIRDRLGWTGRRVVLTAGRLQERKGHDHLLRALPAIRAAVPDVLYAIAGDGERRGALEALTATLGLGDCVQFLGELRDEPLIECYQQCDLLALPNREVNGDFEGFGMVLVEAQACGRPVVAGASGGTAETLRAGETGRVVDCTRPELLAETLIDLLGQPDRLDAMGAAGRQWAVEQFDWDVLAARARDVFSEAAGFLGGAAAGSSYPNKAVRHSSPVGAGAKS